MALPNVFEAQTAQSLIDRINNINESSSPKWGKMNAPTMLAHCNVTYEMAFTDKHPKAGFIKKILLGLFVKNAVVSEKPYPQNSPTAPAFLIKDERNFEVEKQRLIDFINKTQTMGGDSFEGKESLSFGSLSQQEWNNMFYKHLDHHLQQFGV